MPLLLFLLPAGFALWYYARQSANASASSSSSSQQYGYSWGAEIVGDPLVPVVDGGYSLGVLGTGTPWFMAPTIDALPEMKYSTWQLPARAATYAESIAGAESRYGVPSNLLARLIQEESDFRPLARGPVTANGERAQGIAQFMPATARGLGIDPLDPFAAIAAAAKYLRELFDKTGNWSAALAAYNWGIGNVQRKGVSQAPAETRRYVERITADVPV